MVALRRICTITISLIVLCVSIAFAETKPFVNADFSQAKYSKITFKSTDEKVIAGRLPSGWSDNSEWNSQITVNYDQVTEDKVTFLRMDKSAGGRAQLCINIAKKLQPSTYRFTMEVKSPSDSKPEIGVRLSGEPYSFLWSQTPSLSDEWTVIEEEIDLDPEGKGVGIYICLNDNGQLDIKRVKLEVVE